MQATKATLALAGGDQSLVERFDSRVAAAGSQRGHAQDAAYIETTAMDAARAGRPDLRRRVRLDADMCPGRRGGRPART